MGFEFQPIFLAAEIQGREGFWISADFLGGWKSGQGPNLNFSRFLSIGWYSFHAWWRLDFQPIFGFLHLMEFGYVSQMREWKLFSADFSPKLGVDLDLNFSRFSNRLKLISADFWNLRFNENLVILPRWMDSIKWISADFLDKWGVDLGTKCAKWISADFFLCKLRERLQFWFTQKSLFMCKFTEVSQICTVLSI